MERKIYSVIQYAVVIAFIFSILPTVNASSEGDVNIPFYVQTSAGIERASSNVLADILFNYKFDIKKMTQYIPDEKCTLRAEKGVFEIGEEMPSSTNKINFNIPLKNDGPGKGSFSAQYDRDRLSLNFEVTEILETNAERLRFRAMGSGNLNKQNLNFDNIVVNYDKVNSKVSIIGEGDESFSATGLDVTFVKWCGSQETVFYLITIGDLLNPQRTEEEVEEALIQNPELAMDYEGLRNLRSFAVVPEFGMVAGLVTILGAVGVFFFIRRK